MIQQPSSQQAQGSWPPPGGAGAALLLKSTSIGIRLAEVPGDNNDANLPSFSALAARMVFWNRGTGRLLWQELVAIMSKASPDSRHDPTPLA
jgi:hypothetical protein